MTRITKLILFGFKSFAKRTEIDFENSFNVILGPNGSGKSNIIDALSFVLGRMSSKSLRAEKFSHIIYNGGKTKQPATKAEVSIVFDNSNKEFPVDEESVKISRIVKQNGQSTYRINGERRTRSEVIELMSFAKIDPMGHNFILQGDVVKFVDMSPESRRELIEEVSGISIYEDKKKKALNELEKVETKLKEADILLSERKAHLKELKKDRDQALRYRDVETNLKRNKATKINLEIKKFDKKKVESSKEVEKINAEIEKMQTDIESLKLKVEEKKKAVSDITSEIEEKGKKDQVDLNKDIESLRVEIASNKNRTSILDSELLKISERKKQIKEELIGIDSKVKEFEVKGKEFDVKKTAKEEEIKKIDSEISLIRKKSGSDDIGKLDEELSQLDKEEEELQVKSKDVIEEKQELIRNKDKTEFLIQTTDDSISKIESLKVEYSKELKDIEKKKSDFKKLLLKINKYLSEDTANSSKLSDSKNRLSSVSKEVIELRNKFLQVSESVSGGHSVKELLRQKGLGDIYGTVAQLGKVDSKYSVALEACAGPRMKSLVTNNEVTASKGIKFLREKKLGSASFLPLNKVRETSNDCKAYKKDKGVIGIASELISYNSKYKAAFVHVFGSTLVVDNIDNARKIGVGKVRMVTLDGDLIERSGAMFGGYRKRKEKGFSDKKLEDELERKESYEEDLINLVSSLEKKKEEISEEISNLRNEKSEIEGEIIKSEKSLHLDSSDLDASLEKKKELKTDVVSIDKSLASLQKEQTKLALSISSLKQKKQKLKDKINSLRNPRLIAEMNTFTQQRQKLGEELTEINGEINKINVTINDVLTMDGKRANNILKQMDRDEITFTKEKDGLLKQNVSNDKSLKVKESDFKKFQDKFSGLFEKKQKIQEEIQSNEEKIIRKEERINTAEVKINNITIKNSEVMASLAGLNEEFKQYEDVKLLSSVSEEDLKLNIRKYQQALNSIGIVNLKALDIYEDVEKQYNELVEKKNTLMSEKDEVTKLMEEIEEKKQELFIEAFNGLNEKFKTVFSDLSTKGDAYLVLENDKKPLDGGVRVRVRLSNNKFMDIRSLSGGEKTLTALAFIFAIQEYDPASFYVLDEVDAALDKKNSEKLSYLIKKYSDKAQYIVISHNDNVLSEAEVLYGVSMDEQGISNIASLKV